MFYKPESIAATRCKEENAWIDYLLGPLPDADSYRCLDLTFPGSPPSRRVATRRFHRFIFRLANEGERALAWLVVYDYGEEGGRLHLHVVLYNAHRVTKKRVERLWNGTVRVKSGEHATRYVCGKPAYGCEYERGDLKSLIVENVLSVATGDPATVSELARLMRAPPPRSCGVCGAALRAGRLWDEPALCRGCRQCGFEPRHAGPLATVPEVHLPDEVVRKVAERLVSRGALRHVTIRDETGQRRTAYARSNSSWGEPDQEAPRRRRRRPRKKPDPHTTRRDLLPGRERLSFRCPPALLRRVAFSARAGAPYCPQVTVPSCADVIRRVLCGHVAMVEPPDGYPPLTASHSAHVSVWVTPRLKRCVQEAAEREGLSLSTWIRRAIETAPARGRLVEGGNVLVRLLAERSPRTLEEMSVELGVTEPWLRWHVRVLERSGTVVTRGVGPVSVGLTESMEGATRVASACRTGGRVTLSR